MAKYPFQPDILDALPEQVAELFRGLEDRLLEEICSRLKISGELNEVTVQSIKALRAQGIPLEEIEQAISEVTGVALDELDKLLDDVVVRNQRYYDDLIDKADVTKPDILVSEEDIEAIRRQTHTELLNLSQTIGFSIRRGGKVVELTPPAQAFYRALNSAEADIMSGAISYSQAIEKAVRELADSGLKKVEYDSNGRKRLTQTDVAVRRAVLTGINQLNSRYTEQSAERLGTDLFEVSAHAGARDNGVGWQNHKSWQGKVYSLRDDHPKYPSIYKVCGLGQVDGLEGANCRHRRFPFVEGISEPSYTTGELERIDRPAFEFQGEKYTQYEATQRQREIERTVRKYRRREIAYRAAGLEEEANAAGVRIKRLNLLYRDFSEVSGLPMQKERMKVVYPD